MSLPLERYVPLCRAVDTATSSESVQPLYSPVVSGIWADAVKAPANMYAVINTLFMSANIKIFIYGWSKLRENLQPDVESRHDGGPRHRVTCVDLVLLRQEVLASGPEIQPLAYFE